MRSSERQSSGSPAHTVRNNPMDAVREHPDTDTNRSTAERPIARRVIEKSRQDDMTANHKPALARMQDAIEACRQGKMVIIVDDEDRENEGDLVLAAEHVTPDAINFMVTHGRGLVCLAMKAAMLDRLKIPMMVPQAQNSSGFGTGFTVSVEAAAGVTTGISTADRSHTIKTLIDPSSTPVDIAYPGHVFPLRARDGGVLERRGQTEASVDLAIMAGLTPAGVICEVLREDGDMMRLEELLSFAVEHDLCVISVEQMAQYRQSQAVQSSSESTNVHSLDVAQQPSTPTSIDNPATAAANSIVTRIGASSLPTAHGDFRMIVYRDTQGLEHSALVRGDPGASEAPLVRLHSECLTGDAFGSLRCDCGEQLRSAMKQIVDEDCGAILYLRQEGRGIGLGNKIRAYELQDQGRDTVDANHDLGFPADARVYDMAEAMLSDLGISKLRLLSNNPEKRRALTQLGIKVVGHESIVMEPNRHNAAYMRTKAERMGHELSPAEAESVTDTTARNHKGTD